MRKLSINNMLGELSRGTVEPSIRLEDLFLGVLLPVIKMSCSVHVYHIST